MRGWKASFLYRSEKPGLAQKGGCLQGASTGGSLTGPGGAYAAGTARLGLSDKHLAKISKI